MGGSEVLTTAGQQSGGSESTQTAVTATVLLGKI